MARWRVVLQPTTVLTLPAVQDPRFAIETGAARTVRATVNVYENSSGASTLNIIGATHNGLREDPANNAFWLQEGTFSLGASFTGAKVSQLTNAPPALLRWQALSVNARIVFEIILDMWDS